jgi:hypothetical protein
MRIIAKLLYAVLVFLIAKRRRPDQVIGQPNKPYLFRWWLFGASRTRDKYGRLRPRRPFGYSVYLHCFLHPDDDRAHHDHPWNWWSFLLRGPYFEHRYEDGTDSGPYSNGASELTVHRVTYDKFHVIRRYDTGSFRSGLAEDAHRIDLQDDPNPFYAAHGDADKFHWMTPGEENAVMCNDFIPAWTLFITGRLKRDWGFHCPKGWVPWWQFTDTTTGGNQVGAGCGDKA